MQNPDISKNLNKLMAIMLLMLVVATPISVLAVDNLNYYTNSYEYTKNTGTSYGDPQNLGEAITIEVAGQEPQVIKSSQVESADLPIYFFLKGTTLGSMFGMSVETEPFISQPKIKSIGVHISGQSSPYVKSIIYDKPRQNAFNLDNLGVVTVMLKQIKDETKVPEEITLNLSARIYFDFMRGFGGISSSDLLLKESSEEDWKKDLTEKSSFWNGKGYLRLIDVSNNQAKIQVYGSGMSLLSDLFATDEQNTELQRFNERGVLVLSKGEVRTITLPGTSAFFKDQVRIKLNGIADVSKVVKLKISSSDGISYKYVGEGMSISPESNWKVYQINIEKCTEGMISCDGTCRKYQSQCTGNVGGSVSGGIGTGGGKSSTESISTYNSLSNQDKKDINNNIKSTKNKIKEVINFYVNIQNGFSNVGAAYMAGNFLQESSLDPTKKNEGEHAYGIVQWRDTPSNTRWPKYVNWAKTNCDNKIENLNCQLRYTIEEGKSYGLDSVKNSNNKQDWINYIKNYEGYKKIGNRYIYGDLILNDPTFFPSPVVASSIPGGSGGAVMTGFVTAPTKETPTSGKYNVVLRNSVGEKVTLSLTKEQEQKNVITITDSNLEDNKRTVCKEITNENGVSDLLNEQDAQKKRNSAIQLYCTAISKYELAITEDVKIREQAYKGIAKSYVSISDYTAENKQTARALALYYYNKITDVSSMYSEIKELEDKLYTNADSESYYLEDDDIRVSLVDIELNEDQRTSATIEYDGVPQTYYEGKTIITKTDTNNKIIEWKISGIDSETVQLQRFTDGISGGTTILYYEKPVTVEDSTLTLKKVDSKRSAYVTVMPGGGDVYSESSFKVHIPIEKRLIQWTPEQIDRMINETTKQIELLDKYIKQLNSMITSWKYVCFATFALLTIKNSFSGGATSRNSARKDIMPNYNKKCEAEVVTGVKDSGTFDKCMNKYADEIESNLDAAESLQKSILDCKKDQYTSANKEKCGVEDYYPNGYNDKLKDLGFPNPISQDDFEKLQKCKLYSESQLSDELKKQITEDCVDFNKNILAKKDATDKAIAAVKLSIPGDKATTKEKTEYLNQLYLYNNAFTLHETRYSDTEKINKDLVELNKKLSEAGITGVELTSSNLAVEAVSTTSSDSTKPSYNLITVEGNEGALNIKDNLDYIPITNYHATGTTAVNQYNTDCPDAQKITPDCIQKLERLNQPIVLTTSSGNEYRIFKGKENNQDKYYATLETIELTPEGTNKCTAGIKKAQYDDDGRPYCIPTGKDGNYVKILSWYAKGDPDACQLWNSGADCDPCQGMDLLIEDQKRLSTTNQGECVNLARQAGKCTEPGKQVKVGAQSLICDQTAYKIEQIGQGTHCQDVMDPSDCKKLFAVCDPVMCPVSRFNLGGRWPITSGTVVDKGIIGSIVLGLPNFPEDPVPFCLPGILAGLQNIKQLLTGFKECLIAAKMRHENIGICDKIRSVGICELFWREVINIFKLKGGLSSIIYGKLSGVTDGSGGEYLNFNQQIDSVSNSVKYFTSEYGNSAFAAFKGRSTQEIGGEVCKAAIYGKFGDVGDFVNQLAQPENPPQFTAYFDESDWSVSAGKTYSTPYGKQSAEQSIYSVYYFIYAGNIPDAAKTGYARDGMKYAVFLRDDSGNVLPVTVKNSNQLYNTIPYDGHQDVSLEKVGPRGMNKICVFINGREECGYGKVTTEFSLNYLNDRIVASDAANTAINSMEECISEVPRTGPSLGSVALPREYGVLSTGIVRTCSVLDPDAASGQTVNNWNDVGSCGMDKQKNNQGRCWLDMRTIDIKDTQRMQEVQNQIITLGEYNKMTDEAKKDFMNKYYTPEKSKLYYEALELRRDSAKGSDQFLKLLMGGVDIEELTGAAGAGVARYQDLADYSLDQKYKVLSQLALGEIYFKLAEIISPEKVAEEVRQTTIGGGKDEEEKEKVQISSKFYDYCNQFESNNCFLNYCQWTSNSKCEPTTVTTNNVKYSSLVLDLSEGMTKNVDGLTFKVFGVTPTSADIITPCNRYILPYNTNKKVIECEKDTKQITLILTAISSKSATFDIFTSEKLPPEVTFSSCEDCTGKTFNYCSRDICKQFGVQIKKNCYFGKSWLGFIVECKQCPNNCKLSEDTCKENQCVNCHWNTATSKCENILYWFKVPSEMKTADDLLRQIYGSLNRDIVNRYDLVNIDIKNIIQLSPGLCVKLAITNEEFKKLSEETTNMLSRENPCTNLQAQSATPKTIYWFRTPWKDANIITILNLFYKGDNSKIEELVQSNPIEIDMNNLKQGYCIQIPFTTSEYDNLSPTTKSILNKEKPKDCIK